MSTINDNIERFESLLGSVKKDGINDLIKYIRMRTDFYKAPASAHFHLACKGGLLQHSLNVYDCLLAKKSSPIWKPIFEKIPDESLIIMALLHDLCKANFYVETYRNQKSYDPEKVAAAAVWKVKHDSQGDFIWESVQTYTIEDQLPLGHGEKSVMLIQGFIKLTIQEVFAIRWHMGFSEPEKNYSSVGQAMEMQPIVLALHEADLEATKIIEVQNDQN